jgi:hypothetical protein
MWSLKALCEVLKRYVDFKVLKCYVDCKVLKCYVKS